MIIIKRSAIIKRDWHLPFKADITRLSFCRWTKQTNNKHDLFTDKFLAWPKEDTTNPPPPPKKRIEHETRNQKKKFFSFATAFRYLHLFLIFRIVIVCCRGGKQEEISYAILFCFSYNSLRCRLQRGNDGSRETAGKPEITRRINVLVDAILTGTHNISLTLSLCNADSTEKRHPHPPQSIWHVVLSQTSLNASLLKTKIWNKTKLSLGKSAQKKKPLPTSSFPPKGGGDTMNSIWRRWNESRGWV